MPERISHTEISESDATPPKVISREFYFETWSNP